ncbi:tRNA (guanosine(37)-N1)-methyltransferase TrmD [Ureaplasma zalophigenitalium]|uniref:tRNA (guanine-N(1)-)-methyltransferase n=1 Tax=Ureaplasma zalophigenitalium TaxID=907723 RepID=A0ABT3BNW9_9BACT|nr:tRNA (guanosine(37)-N1)-methyltransferase TrmD [Ureaplasma zalophigenitalium]MCV3753925.1 tRNA (guanosine(37)-N1)-methyltransferase TrmD [Ureaplasma zalophigenitalium]
MKISFLTLFPEIIQTWCNHSIIKRAIEANKVIIEIVDIRKFSKDKRQRVDDTPYGGGPGMVISIDVVVRALRSVRTPNSYVIYTSPRGQIFNQKKAMEWSSKKEHLIFIAGHYEGIDERIKYYVDSYISLGDFILTGGELVCMTMADSVIRLIDGVINADSLIDESFNNYLLDYPVYTRPQKYEKHEVPDVLLSGHHALINEYRKQKQEELTKRYRKDLYKKYMQIKTKK